MSPRAAAAGVGAVVLATVWAGPLPELAGASFTAHMTMHMGVVAVGAPLLALGLAGGRLDPARRAPRLFAAVPASAVELLVVWGWHAPELHHAARNGGAALALEQGSFLVAGLLVWISAFGGPGLRRRERAAAGVVGLLLTSMHMTLLGALLGLARRPLYDLPGGTWGLGPLEDQQLGGALMLIVGGIVYLLGGLVLVVRLLRSRLPRGPEAAIEGRPPQARRRTEATEAGARAGSTRAGVAGSASRGEPT